ncbi:hypothetical protein [Clostridium luticellarii]|jgi:hypothetical protein|uniref:hypothetical protein n=1 Tax=Clostridium luticellarii TaxID=1691940 RepID=UPI0023553432|nr:hypothetical protein [Clostridium luticellarii]MCI1969475.1 hypothetical protein [Clostridium luticellarii]MCI2039642.1 hypothetical protein [Clostridium luticellarii]
MLKIELKRAILRKKFLIIIFIGILIEFLSGYNAIHKYIFFDYNASDIQSPALQATARKMVQDGLNMYSVWFKSLTLYTPLMPIIAALPYSLAYLEDVKNGMVKYIDIRINHKKYLFTKLLANGLAGGIAVSFPLIILTVIVSVFFSGSINDFFGKGGYGGVFSNLLIYNFYLYVLVHILINFIFGFAYSSIALAVSSIIKNTIAIMISPFLFWIGADLILQFFNVQSYLPTSINQFYLTPNVTLNEILVELVFITFFSSVIFILKSQKRNIYE